MERRFIVLLGPPGSGKGTQAKMAAQALNVPHISTGDMLRLAVSEGSELGLAVKMVMESGQLVSDSMMQQVVKRRLEQPDCSKGAILDGYPRTVQQAWDLEAIVCQDDTHVIAIQLQVAEEVLRRRLTGRRSCLNCGKVYNIYENPSPAEPACDFCGSQLVQRSDDQEGVVTARLAEYAAKTEPLLGYYKQLGLLRVLEGNQDVPLVHKEIIRLIGAS